jgi:hypothetical protein
VKKHNVDVDALTEWIEGCITFDEKSLSIIDLADILVAEQVYDEQDFAKERIADAWVELRRRRKCLGDPCPFTVAANRVDRARPWQQTPAYAFCLMVALQVPYREHFTDLFGTDYTQQGVLFERLTAEALGKFGWKIHSTA